VRLLLTEEHETEGNIARMSYATPRRAQTGIMRAAYDRQDVMLHEWIEEDRYSSRLSPLGFRIADEIAGRFLRTGSAL
jgi:hypothetical protein